MKIALLLLVLCSCSDRSKPEVKRDPEPERQRRVIEPPSGRVRPLPPHAIRADGVGPYRLKASLAELLEQLPSGPRIATLDIPGVVHQSLLRAENEEILIGGEPLGKASFIAVIGPEVARTESGVHVGSTRAELTHALGAPLGEPDHARDPRLVASTGMRNARAVLDGDHVVALVVIADPEAPHAKDASAESACTRPTPEPETKRIGACLGGGELVAYEGDDIVVRSAESEKVIVATRVPGLVYVAPLRNPTDGRDELVAIARTADPQQRGWTLLAYRLEGSRLVKAVEPSPLYQLTAASARWIGAELGDLDLYLELTSRLDTIEVGGLLTTRIADKIHDVVVISPVSVPRRHAKSAPFEAPDAGTPDASSGEDAAMNPDRPPR
ncbi:MAG: hypothetical protein JWO36_5118 [Myxococcales bacterium]|nr:hypothetical protein [Myxococcales bacterium]